MTGDTVELALPQTAAGATARPAQAPWRSGCRALSARSILAELKRSHYHVTNAAKALGLERSHLYKKAEQLGIDLQSLRNEPGDNPQIAENTVETVLDRRTWV